MLVAYSSIWLSRQGFIVSMPKLKNFSFSTVLRSNYILRIAADADWRQKRASARGWNVAGSGVIH